VLLLYMYVSYSLDYESDAFLYEARPDPFDCPRCTIGHFGQVHANRARSLSKHF
jgi:hypothetical protein